jgi:alpha-1,2-mannosyltransferase
MSSPARPRYSLVLTAALLLFFYLIFAASNARLMLAMRADPHAAVMSATQELPQSDYARFWYAGRHYLAGMGLAAPPDKSVFVQDILSPRTPPLKLWLYPPMMALLAMPFAVVSLALSFWLWRAVSLLAGAWLLRRAGLGWGVVFAGLFSPAALHDMTAGQNGTLTGALLVGALLLADRQPWLAGMLGGLLCIKPQAALVLPAALLRWRFRWAVAAAAVTVGLLALASLAVEGRGAWTEYLQVARPAATAVIDLPLSVFFPVAGITPLAMLRSLHVALPVAWAVQGAVSLGCFGLIWLAWWPARMAPVPRMALTCCLGVLATPYGFSYDLVAYSIGVAGLFFASTGWVRLALALLWLMGGYTITLANDTGLILFPLWAACGAGLAWRLRHTG